MILKNTEKKENSIVSFTIEIDANEFEAAINKAYLKNKKKIYVPGFRKGKAPRLVVEGYYGANVFHEDAFEELYPAAYDLGTADDSFEPVGRPSIADLNVAEDKTASITFETAIYPEVTLGQYSGLEAAKTVGAVTEEDIIADIDRMREKGARIETVERPIQDGDIAVIDFEGFLENVAFDGGKAENHELTIGSGQFIPGFEEKLIGMTTGEERDIDLTFPESYHAENLAGKPVLFKVKVNEIKEKQLPELDDELAKDVSEFETLAELKADVKARLEKGREGAAENMFREALLKQAIDNMTVEVPAAMLEETIDGMMQEYTRNMAQYGMTLEQYAGMMGMDVQGLRGTMVPVATHRVKTNMLFRAIYEKENIEVSDEAVDEEYKKLSEQYGMELDKVKELIPEDGIKKDLGYLKAADAVYTTGVALAE